MNKENLILISADAVRPDRLSCYGYDKIETKGIDAIAQEGTLFKNCICTSCLTPVSHASILSGMNPDKTGFRDPFNVVKTKMLSEFLKELGYKTGGFIGIDLLGSRHHFNRGFDHFDEPSDDDSFHTMFFQGRNQKIKARLGSWWVDRMFKWLEKNINNPFFIFCHYFHVHFLAEKELLYSGKLEPGILSDNAYYDAKIKYMDEQLFQPLIKILKDADIWDRTTIVITSDHGETLGTTQPTWKTFYFEYPQHKTMYEPDLKVPLIIKNKKLKNIKIDHTVRAIDIVPTLVDLLDIPTDEEFDGIDLMPLIRGEQFPELVAYSEELFENRGAGSLQAVRTPKYKLIKNITKCTEEFYNLQKDPEEKHDVLASSDPEEKEIIKQFQKIMDDMYRTYEASMVSIGEKERKKIKNVVRNLKKKEILKKE